MQNYFSLGIFEVFIIKLLFAPKKDFLLVKSCYFEGEKDYFADVYSLKKDSWRKILVMHSDKTIVLHTVVISGITCLILSITKPIFCSSGYVNQAIQIPEKSTFQKWTATKCRILQVKRK